MLSSPDATLAQCLPGAFLTVGRQAVPVATTRSSSLPTAAASTAAQAGDAAQHAGVVQLTEAQVLALPVVTIETGTDWTGEVRRFEGPLLSDVLGVAPGQSGVLSVLTLNHYGVKIPLSDLVKFRPILAYAQNGGRLERDDFGPSFIVYPRDRYSELRTPSMAARMACQVCRIDAE